MGMRGFNCNLLRDTVNCYIVFAILPWVFSNYSCKILSFVFLDTAWWWLDHDPWHIVGIVLCRKRLVVFDGRVLVLFVLNVGREVEQVTSLNYLGVQITSSKDLTTDTRLLRLQEYLDALTRPYGRINTYGLKLKYAFIRVLFDQH